MEQALLTVATIERIKQFLNYSSQDKIVVTYKASNMVLVIHSDASYLTEPKARSRAEWHFFISNNEQFSSNSSAVLNV